MSQVYDYSVANDTGQGVVNVTQLTVEVDAANLGEDAQSIYVVEDAQGQPTDVLRVIMAAAITKADLDAVVTAHQGNAPIHVDIHGSVQMVGDEKSITIDGTGNPGTWEVLGRVVTRPAFFGDVAQMFGRITGEGQCDDGPAGELAELRVVEDNAGVETVMNSTPFQIPNSGAWQVLSFSTDVPPSATMNECIYRVEGRLNGSTSAKVRGLTISIMEVH